MSINARTLAIFFAATFIPASILAGTVGIAIIKLTNPENIDVTQGLAYLGYAVIPAVVAMVTWIVATVILSFVLRKRDGNFRSARLPIAILLLNVLLGVGILGFRELTGVAEDSWSKTNGQPTREERSKQLDEFFDKLEENKN